MRSLFDMPSQRECPGHVLRALRAVDPRADLLYLGEGCWQLLYQKADSAVAREGDKLIALERRRVAAARRLPILRQARLMQQGARSLGDYFYQGEPDESIADEFRFKMGRTERELEEDFAVQLDVSEGGPRERRSLYVLKELREAEGRSIFRHAFRHRVSITTRR
jgi:hypothetical protein